MSRVLKDHRHRPYSPILCIVHTAKFQNEFAQARRNVKNQKSQFQTPPSLNGYGSK